MTRTILITSVGSLVGSSIIESLAPKRKKWRIVGVNSQAEAVNNFKCDVTYLAPETAQESDYLSRLRSILRDEQPAVIVAGRDSDLLPLAKLKTESEFKRSFFLVPGKDCVSVVNDKYETWNFANRHGLPFAATAYDRAELNALIAQTGFPLICKRRFGNASKDAFIVRSTAEADAALADEGFIFQEFLNPPQNPHTLLPDFRFGMPLFYGFVEHDHYSAQGLIGADGQLIAFIATLHVLEGGKSISVRPIDEPKLEQLTADYAHALGPLGYIGPINFNCKKVGAGHFVPYEINGRFTGASASRAALGHPEVEYALDYFLDGRLPKCRNKSNSLFMRQIIHRRPQTQLFNQDMVAKLISEEIWCREP